MKDLYDTHEWEDSEEVVIEFVDEDDNVLPTEYDEEGEAITLSHAVTIPDGYKKVTGEQELSGNTSTGL